MASVHGTQVLIKLGCLFRVKTLILKNETPQLYALGQFSIDHNSNLVDCTNVHSELQLTRLLTAGVGRSTCCRLWFS